MNRIEIQTARVADLCNIEEFCARVKEFCSIERKKDGKCYDLIYLAEKGQELYVEIFLPTTDLEMIGFVYNISIGLSSEQDNMNIHGNYFNKTYSGETIRISERKSHHVTAINSNSELPGHNITSFDEI